MSTAFRRFLPPFALAAAGLAQAPFQLATNSPFPTILTGYDLCIGDVDWDGDVDIVTGNDHAPNQLLLNDGRGTFVDATAGRLTTPAAPPPGGAYANATYEVDLADIDGDGDLDLLVSNDHFLPNRLYTNDGTGHFTDVTATALPAVTHDTYDQVVADFDGDGDVDWLILGYPTTRLFANDGTGVFTDISATHLVGATYTNSDNATAADLDADGDLDVVVPNYAANMLLLGNQGGVLTAVTTGLPAGATGFGFVVDVDADGLPDLVTGSGQRLLRNSGAFVFVDATAARLPAGTTALRTACDVDRDGDPDLVGNGMLLVNDGAGFFTGSTGFTSPVGGTLFTTVVVADFDGDGDLDLADLASDVRGSTWNNTLAQIRTPTAPALGQPYTIELHCRVRPTPVLWAPAVANGGASLSVTGFTGVLRLDPTSALPLWCVFSTTGFDSITWTIPALPALVGVELHYQAAVLDPVRPPFLSNAVRDVIQ